MKYRVKEFIMKRWIIFALALVLALGMACGCAFAAASLQNILPCLSFNPEWEYVGKFENGYAEVEYSNGATGYINPYGEYLQSPSVAFDMSAFEVSAEPKTMHKGSKSYIVDAHNNVLLDGLEEANDFSQGVAAVKRGGIWFVIDAKTIMQHTHMESGAENRVMKSNVLEGTGIDRSGIYQICFENFTNNAPANAWDASAGADSTVIAYLTDGYALHIAAEGGVIAGEDCRGLFADYVNLIEVQFGGNLDTSDTRYVAGMFRGCEHLSIIDLEMLDLSKAEDAGYILDDFGAAAEAVQPEQEPAEEPESNPFEDVYLKIGSRGEEVRNAQQALIDLGYLGGKADGIYGNNTANAVKAYQRDHGYAETGEIDGVLYREICEQAASRSPEDTSEAENDGNDSDSNSGKTDPGNKKPSGNKKPDNDKDSGANPGGNNGGPTSTPIPTPKPATDVPVEEPGNETAPEATKRPEALPTMYVTEISITIVGPSWEQTEKEDTALTPASPPDVQQ